MKIIDRRSGKIIKEEEDSAKIIGFLYHSFFGRLFLKLFFARPYFSKLLSIYYKSPLSKNKIKSFIKNTTWIEGFYREILKALPIFFQEKKR